MLLLANPATTSGTYNFFLSNGEVVLSAYARCGVRRTAIDAEHMIDARTELNLLLSEWSNEQVNLFDVDLVSVALTEGTSNYAVDSATVMILDAYISDGTTDRIITPISRTEYASFPDKTLEGSPNVFWFNRGLLQSLTLWPVPDSSTTYTLKYYRCFQNQDADIPDGETPAIPYRWLDAMVAGLAHRLARIHAPQLEAVREQDAMKAWSKAATQDVENSPLYITPALSGYFSQR